MKNIMPPLIINYQSQNINSSFPEPGRQVFTQLIFTVFNFFVLPSFVYFYLPYTPFFFSIHYSPSVALMTVPFEKTLQSRFLPSRVCKSYSLVQFITRALTCSCFVCLIRKHRDVLFLFFLEQPKMKDIQSAACFPICFSVPTTGNPYWA